MTQLPTQPGAPRTVAPQSDIYTVLMIVSATFLAGAVGFLAYRLITLYGTLIPPVGG